MRVGVRNPFFYERFQQRCFLFLLFQFRLLFGGIAIERDRDPAQVRFRDLIRRGLQHITLHRRYDLRIEDVRAADAVDVPELRGMTALGHDVIDRAVDTIVDVEFGQNMPDDRIRRTALFRRQLRERTLRRRERAPDETQREIHDDIPHRAHVTRVYFFSGPAGDIFSLIHVVHVERHGQLIGVIPRLRIARAIGSRDEEVEVRGTERRCDRVDFVCRRRRFGRNRRGAATGNRRPVRQATTPSGKS